MEGLDGHAVDGLPLLLDELGGDALQVALQGHLLLHLAPLGLQVLDDHHHDAQRVEDQHGRDVHDRPEVRVLLLVPRHLRAGYIRCGQPRGAGGRHGPVAGVVAKVTGLLAVAVEEGEEVGGEGAGDVVAVVGVTGRHDGVEVLPFLWCRWSVPVVVGADADGALVVVCGVASAERRCGVV